MALIVGVRKVIERSKYLKHIKFYSKPYNILYLYIHTTDSTQLFYLNIYIIFIYFHTRQVLQPHDVAHETDVSCA